MDAPNITVLLAILMLFRKYGALMFKRKAIKINKSNKQSGIYYAHDMQRTKHDLF